MQPIVSMFDESGLMLRPWAERGFHCYAFDILNVDREPEHFEGGGYIRFMYADLMPDDWRTAGSTNAMIDAITDMKPLVVFGFGPCTELATCGAKHFANKLAIDPDCQAQAVALWRTTETVGIRTGAPWFAENPRSVLSTMYRKPDFKFDPSDYGGYLAEDDVNPLYPEIIPPRGWANAVFFANWTLKQWQLAA